MTNTPPEGASNKLDLTILIPAYNEEAVIANTVGTLVDHFRPTGVAFEVLVVNNNSKDGTSRVLSELADRYGEVRWMNSPQRPGYGVAVRAGLDAYRGDAVVIVMADGSESPADIEKLFRLIQQGADCGFGTRFAEGDRTVGYPAFKLVLNRLGNRMLGLLSGFRYDDFTNGFKAYRRWVIDAMQPLRGEEFELTVEMAVKAVNSGARIAVAPNSWRERDQGASKFKVLRQSRRYLQVLAPTLLSSDSSAMAFLRFLLVGAASTGAYFLVLTVLAGFARTSVVLAVCVAYVVGTIVSYLGSSLVAFRKPLTGATLAKFLVVVGAAFIVNIVLAAVLERLGFHYLAIGGIIVAVVFMSNFLAHRHWTFKDT